MPSVAEIETALLDHLDQLNLDASYLMIDQNRRAPEATDQIYLAVRNVRSGTSRLWVDSDSNDMQLGFLQVSIVLPYGSGEGQGLALGDTIIEHFPKDLMLPADDPILTITQTGEIGDGIPGEPHWTVPITIYWETIT